MYVCILKAKKHCVHKAPARLLIGGRFLIGQKIANGAFGQLRLGTDINVNGEGEGGNISEESLVAVKMERADSKIPMLFLEYRFYKMLGPFPGLPR